MASNDLHLKYTIEKYYTKQELVKKFGSNLVDPIWKEISAFRKRLAIELPFFDTTHTKFYLTYIDPVQAKNTQINGEVVKFVESYSKLSSGSISRYTFTRSIMKEMLSNVAKLNKIQVSDIALTHIIDGEEVEDEYKILVHYFNALKELQNTTFGAIDESFLAKNYATLRGEIELTSFYRTTNTKSASSMALIDRDYDQGIPAHMIDDLMSPLFDYINSFDVALVSRITAIYFVFNYIKPFEEYNLELATILAKKVLASTNIESSAIYIPLEIFMNNNDFFETISKEVKKTHDFTYAYLSGGETINEAFDIAIAKINEVYANRLDTESKMGSDESSIKKEFGEKVVVPKQAISTPRGETKKQIQQRIEAKTIIQEQPKLTNKEYKERINDLLESDPFLKKSQADFYVHHCTIGKFYTIQQYVKYTGCVYETGRKAMDGLAKYGYYRREQIKNKFVYTPINKE